jgi:hypothetical protein
LISLSACRAVIVLLLWEINVANREYMATAVPET